MARKPDPIDDFPDCLFMAIIISSMIAALIIFVFAVYVFLN